MPTARRSPRSSRRTRPSSSSASTPRKPTSTAGATTSLCITISPAGVGARCCAAKVEGSSQSATRVEGFVPPSLADEVAISVDFLESRPGQLEFEIPPEFRIGFWGAPYPELRLELDLAYAAWSEVDNSLSRVTPPPACAPAGCPFLVERRWDDSVSVRLGFEGDVTDHAALSGGVAYEPSPVSSSQVEPGFPRGDAYVYALGWSYNFPELSFDIGYSFHDHQGRGDRFGGRYSASERVFAFAVRWR